MAIFNAPFDVVGGGDFFLFVFMIIQMNVKETRPWNSEVMISAIAIVVDESDNLGFKGVSNFIICLWTSFLFFFLVVIVVSAASQVD